MTMAPNTPPETEAKRKPSVEHIVLASVLAAVVLVAGVWFVMKPGSGSASSATPVGKTAIVHHTPTDLLPAIKVHPPKPVTKAKPNKALTAYLKAGNKLCAKELVAVRALGPVPKAQQQLAAWVAEVKPIAAQSLKAFRALTSPTPDKKMFAKLYDDEARDDALVYQLAAAVEQGNGQLAQDLGSEANDAGTALNAEYTAAGLPICAESP